MTAETSPGLRCTYLGCTARPTRRLAQSIGGGPWFGCNEHYPAMVDALYVGMPGAASGGSWVDVTEVPAERVRR